MKVERQRFSICAGSVLLMILMALDMLTGKAASGPQVLLMLRAPRVATAILAGAALSLAGSQMQSVLRNPLADPHIMGVSAGASLGAAIATMSGNHVEWTPWSGIFHSISITGAAFIGAMISATIILAVSKRFRGASTLLIFGVMLGFIVNATVSILQFSSDAERLKIFYSWSAGSFANTTWSQIAIMAVMLVAGGTIAASNRKGLDIILFGDEFAEMAGARPDKIRLSALVSSCLLTSAVTSFCGPIGFVGIVAPHMAKGILKTSSHRAILPSALLTGALISMIADLLSQLSPTPLPTASTMAVVGIPAIFYMILKNDRR